MTIIENIGVNDAEIQSQKMLLQAGLVKYFPGKNLTLGSDALGTLLVYILAPDTTSGPQPMVIASDSTDAPDCVDPQFSKQVRDYVKSFAEQHGIARYEVSTGDATQSTDAACAGS
ncbi:hypothetical protein JT358_09985 [Micrococcales bacterium 31B]|nr:hypothetical protein [Micrococcales bacterium 31B]